MYCTVEQYEFVRVYFTVYSTLYTAYPVTKKRNGPKRGGDEKSVQRERQQRRTRALVLGGGVHTLDDRSVKERRVLFACHKAYEYKLVYSIKLESTPIMQCDYAKKSAQHKKRQSRANVGRVAHWRPEDRSE